MPLPIYRPYNSKFNFEPLYLNKYNFHIEDEHIPENFKIYMISNVTKVDISDNLKLNINGCEEHFHNMVNYLPTLKNVRVDHLNKKGEQIGHVVMELYYIKCNITFSYDLQPYQLTNPIYEYKIIKMKAYDLISYQAQKRGNKLNKI